MAHSTPLLAAALVSLSGSPAWSLPGEFVLGQPAVQQLSLIQEGAMGLRRSMAAFRAGEVEGQGVTPDPSVYKVYGIDVAHYDGDIDWSKVAKAGVSFAFIKATEGEETGDEMFQKNWKGAAQAKVLRGAYHFYNFCKGGAAQADFFTKTVPADPGALPPVVDIEKSKSCSTLPSKEKLHKELAAFMTKVKAKYGKTPVIYINAELYDKYFANEEMDNPLWICDLKAVPAMSDKRPWAFWQYSFTGHVDGIAGSELDLDVFNGTKEQLAALAGANP